MGGLELALRLVGGVFLTLANAFFVVTEFALTRLPQLDPVDDAYDLARARQMTERLEIYLTGCQLGITSSSILLGVIAEPAFTYLLRPVVGLFGVSEAVLQGTSVVLAVVIINLIHKIWGEQTPTYLGVERPRQVAYYAAPLLYGWTKITYPFIMAGDGLAKLTLRLGGVEVERSWMEAEDEGVEEPIDSVAAVRRKMGEVLSRTDLSEERRTEVLRALEIEEVPIRDIMVPRSNIAALTTEASLEANLAVMRAHSFSRYPLIGASWDDLRGTVYTSAVFRDLKPLQSGELDIEDVAHPALTMPADMVVSDSIDRFQEKRQELALVVEDGAVVGLITATDAFETIAGELEDPIDTERLIVPEKTRR